MNRARYAVGIDPGRDTGKAIYDRHEKKLVDVSTTDFWGVYNAAYASSPEDFEFFVEVPHTKKNWQKSQCAITSVNIGSVLRESVLLADGIEQLGFITHRIHPQGKVSHVVLRKITGYSGKTNQHVRDAIMLCWQR